MRLIKCIAPAIVMACACSANAATITWNFNTPNGAVAGPKAYLDTTASYTLTAQGFTTTASPANPTVGQTWGAGAGFNFNAGTIAAKNLYGKTSSADETGLGLDGLDADHEIQNNSFIQLDLADIIAKHLTDLTLIVTSVQTNEGFFVWGSNTANTPGTLLKIGTNPGSGGDIQSFLVPSYGTYRYISISAHGGDVLIGNGATAKTPEPATAALLIFGAAAVINPRTRKTRAIA